jgi:hypothetical protein
MRRIGNEKRKKEREREQLGKEVFKGKFPVEETKKF